MPNKNTINPISWTASEFTQYEKTRAWFITFGLIMTALLIIALLMKNYIFALIIFLSAFLIYIQALKKPRKIKFTISEEGVKINEALHPYNELNSFWIFEEPELKILSLESKKILRPRIAIPLSAQDPKEIRQILAKSIPEKKQEESLSDLIARKIKF